MSAEDDDNLPLFRPLTREDLAVIENLQFENELAEKKKAERRAKNIAVREDTSMNNVKRPLVNWCNGLQLSRFTMHPIPLKSRFD